MSIVINGIFFTIAGLLLFCGWRFFRDRSRTVDQLPGILLMLLGVREIFFIIPNLPEKIFQLGRLETYFLLFFQGIIAAYLISIISVKRQQDKLIKNALKKPHVNTSRR